MLKALDKPEWINAWRHPELGPRTGSMYLTSWLAHDYLHIRQINALKYALLMSKSGEDLSYAGNW